MARIRRFTPEDITQPTQSELAIASGRFKDAIDALGNRRQRLLELGLKRK